MALRLLRWLFCCCCGRNKPERRSSEGNSSDSSSPGRSDSPKTGNLRDVPRIRYEQGSGVGIDDLDRSPINRSHHGERSAQDTKQHNTRPLSGDQQSLTSVAARTKDGSQVNSPVVEDSLESPADSAQSQLPGRTDDSAEEALERRQQDEQREEVPLQVSQQGVIRNGIEETAPSMNDRQQTVSKVEVSTRQARQREGSDSCRSSTCLVVATQQSVTLLCDSEKEQLQDAIVQMVEEMVEEGRQFCQAFQDLLFILRKIGFQKLESLLREQLEKEREERSEKRDRGKQKRKLEQCKADLIKELRDRRGVQESLGDRFNEQRIRALYHDGHFQVMDDSISRDKLIPRFKALYDQSDMDSEKIEDLVGDEKSAQWIEDNSGEFFQKLLKVAFEESNKAYQKLKQRVSDTLIDWLHGEMQPSTKQPLDDEGSDRLFSELLRQNVGAQAPDMVLEGTMDQMNAMPFVGKLIGFFNGDSQLFQNSEDIITSFASSCVDVAWPLRLLPVPLETGPTDPLESYAFDEAVHERHSTSNPKGEIVKEFMWPGLFLRGKGDCLVKAIVITIPGDPVSFGTFV